MWDKPSELNILSSVLLATSLLLVLVGALHYVLHSPLFALRAVRVDAAPQHVAAAEIEAVVRNELRGNFFTIDLEATRRAFEKLPWVRKASVRRQFPWQLEVELEEHVALASWNGTALVNTYGEVFKAESERVMPSFIGQPDSAAEVARMYAALAGELAPIRQKIAQISLSPRHTWQLRLSNGMLLKLGNEQPQQRLAQFVAVYPYSLAALGSTASYVDLRYRNGFAAFMPGGAGGTARRAPATPGANNTGARHAVRGA